MRIIGLIAVLLTGSLLFLAVDDLPDWGDPHSPANAGPVSQHFITQVEAETKVPNIVTAVLADYRSYDTMFETVVILTAGIAIIAILTGLGPLDRPGRPVDARDDMIVRKACRLLIPVIQLFALYVLAHGHHSPGGGFQGGVILGASFILMALSRGLGEALKRFSERKALFYAVFGILFYAGFGVAAQLLGGSFLDYEVLHQIFPVSPVMARYHSMLGVEIGVCFTVSAIMFSIYANLSSRGAMEKGL